MGAWGYGLFQSDHDLDIVSDLTREAGIHELKKDKKKEHAKYTKKPKNEKKDNGFGVGMVNHNDNVYVGTQTPNYAPGVEDYVSIYNPNREDVALVRNHLDSGVLASMLEKYETKLLSGEEDLMLMVDMREPGYIFMILGACAMTCGCTIPKTYKATMQKIYMCVDLPADAIQQMKKALNGPHGFKEGEPYDFKSQGLMEKMSAPRHPNHQPNDFGMFGMNVPGPGTMFYHPPKGSTKGLEQLKQAKANEAKYGKEACGGCGAKEKEDGSLLQECAKCKAQKYCSKECQKKQWHFHQRVCKAVSNKENEVM